LLPQPCLCLVTDRNVGDERTLVSRVVDAVAGGVDLVQLREKDLPGGRLLELALSLKDTIGDAALLVINERVDVAVVSGAAGVQLGEEGLPVKAARRLLGTEPLIGRSVHSLEGATEAVAQGADFLIVGTMYATPSHPGARPAGPGLVSQIARHCPVPLLGIGGINSANLSDVLCAGASGVAVISSILASPNPKEAARQLKQAMLAARPAASEGARHPSIS
jgi:thiamine-phosphate pyrophosphorylase